MTNKSVHVVPNKERGGWDVKTSGSQRAYKHTDTQKEAINIARPLSRNQDAELNIHNRKGQIREKDSHGNDPFPPRG